MDNLTDTNRIIKKKINQVFTLLGGINNFNTRDNRLKLHKAYDLVYEIKQILERLGDSNEKLL